MAILLIKALFRLGARARCSGTGTILSTSLNAVPKANTIKTVPSTGITSIGSARARHCFDCARFEYCVQTSSAQNSARS